MQHFKRFIYSILAIILIGGAYYWLLKSIYYNPTTNSYTESSLNDNFFNVVKELLSINFDGKSVSIFSLTAITMIHLAISFFAAVIFGILIGVIIGTNKTIGRISDDYINFFRVLPSIVFIIIFKYQFKMFENHVYFVGAIASIWPIIINTKSGVEKKNGTLREAMSILDIPPIKKLLLLTLPEASPNIWDGIRISIGISFLISITCEYLTKPLYGLGSILSFYDESPGYACQSMLIILWIGFLGVLTNFLLNFIESKISWLKNQHKTDNE
jgi:ABC-type nitrate/sulfonate/bicarbonate transport system permease component